MNNIAIYLRIKTDKGEHGGVIEKGFSVPVRDKKTRRDFYEQLDEDKEYQGKDLDRTILSPNHIRAIMESYKNSIFVDLYPEREPTWVPKTLIFAKDDHHAEEIVRITREVFNKGNDFCQKITYNVYGKKPEELIKEFRTSPQPRIAVTVDMIATGTDIKPLEVVIFMRDVKSSLYYEQMKGRGVRSISDTDLKQVTPNAEAKRPDRLLTNIVQLVRFAIGIDDRLESFDVVANQRFNLWVGRQLKKGIEFTVEQKQWLETIKDHILANAYVGINDVQNVMEDRGGIIKAKEVFGNDLEQVLDDLSLALVA